jgi:SAM-dependent methyltransferase
MKLSLITPTHDPLHLLEVWESIESQTKLEDWEWIIFCNGQYAKEIAVLGRHIAGTNERVRVVSHPARDWGIGQIKLAAFQQATGDLLIELDHDDRLAPTALETLTEYATNHPNAGFFYSDWTDFEGKTYEMNRAAWEASGWTFYEAEIAGKTYLCPRSFRPSAASLSTILWAPNHIRAWRRSWYEEVGGHKGGFDLCDDHDLLIRTYLHTEMIHIPKPLYLYRIHKGNTWAPRADEIREKSTELGRKNIEALVLREAKIVGLPAYDLGGALNPREGWIPVDNTWASQTNKTRTDGVEADLRERWPWEDGSVFAFRAHDLLEHLPDKQHTMSEIWRCLAPGGWLLSETPSTDGRGAFMDPTHVSYWNEPAFWYWIHDEQAKYISNRDIRFQMAELTTHFPSPWHRQHNISYVRANLHKRAPDGPIGRPSP